MRAAINIRGSCDWVLIHPRLDGLTVLTVLPPHNWFLRLVSVCVVHSVWWMHHYREKKCENDFVLNVWRLFNIAPTSSPGGGGVLLWGFIWLSDIIPRGLRRGSATARLLGLLIRIPMRAWLCISLLSIVGCQAEASALGWSLVRRSRTKCVFVVRMIVRRPWSTKACCALGRGNPTD